MTRKSPLNFGSHLDPESVFGPDLLWRRSTRSGCSHTLFSNSHVSYFTCGGVRLCEYRRPTDDSDYDDHPADEEASDHVIGDVSAGRLMTCTGLVEMPQHVPPGDWQTMISKHLFISAAASRENNGRCKDCTIKTTEAKRISLCITQPHTVNYLLRQSVYKCTSSSRDTVSFTFISYHTGSSSSS